MACRCREPIASDQFIKLQGTFSLDAPVSTFFSWIIFAILKWFEGCKGAFGRGSIKWEHSIVE
jgi:hypothetical protein